jgi:hypothetical protein
MSDDYELDDDSDFFEPEFDEWYTRMLDAVGEYMDTISDREDQNITQRDITIIRALIDFYGFHSEDMMEVLDDVVARAELLEQENSDIKH